MSSNDPISDPRPDYPADERLDSWKEIAAYLKRSVRSVQRWEAEEGMPVHRHLHDKRGTIYGFKSELDAWWKERGAILMDRNGEEEPEVLPPAPEVFDRIGAVASVDVPRRHHWKVALIGSGFALSILVVGVVAWLSRNGGRSGSLRPLPFKARDWVLVTSFENRTGEALLDGTLEYAFSRELANSRYVNVVPRERTADVLRLMRRPTDARLDVASGREVCLRDGGIRALIAGRIEKIGSEYVTSVETIDPTSGTILAGFSEQTARREGTLAALARLSRRVRVALGEVLPPIEQARPSLAKATTSSLKALQLLTQADNLIQEDNSAAAEELLRQAVAEDPEFAMGWIYLAWAVSNQGKAEAEALGYADKANRLSTATSDRERLFIRGSYHHLSGQMEKACVFYETLLKLHPDEYQAAINLTDSYQRLGRGDDAARIQSRIADLRPRNFSANVWAAYRLALSGGDLGRVRSYVARARSVVSADVLQKDPGAVAWLELYPAFEHWLGGRLGESSKAVDRVTLKIDSLGEVPRNLFVDYVGSFNLTLGRFRAAEEVFRKNPNRNVRALELSRLALARRDTEAVRTHLRSLGEGPSGEWSALLFARAGLLEDSLRIVRTNESDFRPGWAATIRGEIARGRGRIDQAIMLLVEGTQWSSGWTGFYKHFLGSESLAMAWTVKRNPMRAIAVLEAASKRRWAVFERGGALWIQNQSCLAKLYRQVGRMAEAEEIENDLLTLLSQADSDHPVLLGIRRARANVSRVESAG